VIDVSKPRKVVEMSGGSDTLPAGKVFPIQIGSELFRLSGASISSDGKLLVSNMFRYCSRIAMLRVLEHPHTSRIFLENNFATMLAVLVT